MNPILLKLARIYFSAPKPLPTYLSGNLHRNIITAPLFYTRVTLKRNLSSRRRNSILEKTVFYP